MAQILPRMAAVAMAAAGLLFAGCQGAPARSSKAWSIPAAELTDAQVLSRLILRGGHSGTVRSLDDLFVAASVADVVILGEQHGEWAIHRASQAVGRHVLAQRKSGAVALEMLSRDLQPMVDLHLSGDIDQASFVAAVTAEGSLKRDAWMERYQPLVDAAREFGAAVIAANAPRRHAALARTAGYDVFGALPAGEHALSELPRVAVDDGYRHRFDQAMQAHHPSAAAESAPATDAFFRSQLLWDATMADSVLRGLDRFGPPVVLVVGQFHSDYRGGLVQMLAQLRPDLRILTLSFQPGQPWTGTESEQDRADLVIHVGKLEPSR